MGSQSGLLCGVIAMACWGIGDFVVARTVRRTGAFNVLAWSQVIGLVPYVPALFFLNSFQMPTWGAVGTVLVSGIVVTLAYLSLYKGLQVGKVSIITPISACWAIVTVVLSAFLFRESLSTIQIVAVTLAIMGGVAASFKWGDLRRLSFKTGVVGIQYAFFAMIGLGLYYVLLDVLVSEIGWFLPVLLVRLVVVSLLFTYSVTTKRDVSFPKEVALLVILAGFLEFIAFLSYGIGINSEYTSLVAPVSAASPVVTIALAKIFLGENLELNQWAGVVVVSVSLVLLFL